MIQPEGKEITTGPTEYRDGKVYAWNVIEWIKEYVRLNPPAHPTGTLIGDFLQMEEK